MYENRKRCDNGYPVSSGSHDCLPADNIGKFSEMFSLLIFMGQRERERGKRTVNGRV